MEFNLPYAADGYAELARAMDMATTGTPDVEAAARAIDGITAIRESLGLPERLDLRVDEPTVSRLAGWAAANAGPNPRMTMADDAAALIRMVTVPDAA